MSLLKMKSKHTQLDSVPCRCDVIHNLCFINSNQNLLFILRTCAMGIQWSERSLFDISIKNWLETRLEWKCGEILINCNLFVCSDLRCCNKDVKVHSALRTRNFLIKSAQICDNSIAATDRHGNRIILACITVSWIDLYSLHLDFSNA